MALDGIYLYSLINELKKSILNSKIDKISQPEKDEVILTLRKDRKNIKLLLSASSKFPRIQITQNQKENPLKAPMFLMVLRKYLINGRILNITQLEGDRIVEFSIEASDEMGFNSNYKLMVEIMGRHSNISLVRERDNKIMECIKHITPDINTYRLLLPGVSYVYPPKSTRLNPFSFSKEDVASFIATNNLEIDQNIFSSLFTGVSKPLSSSLYEDFKEGKKEDVASYITSFISNIEENESFVAYKDQKGNYKDFYSLSLSTLKDSYEEVNFNSPWELMDTYYTEKDKGDRLQNRGTSLQRLINTNIDRCKKKEDILNKTLKECEEKESFRMLGDLLTSYIYSFKKGDEKVNVFNYFNEENEEYIDIKLDPNKTPSENVQSYYKKYNKQKKAEEGALEQLEKNSIELNYLYSVLTNLINVDSYTEIEDIKRELMETGYIKFRKSGKGNGKIKPSKPLHFVSSEGIDIYVGKNNLQNEELTFKFANRNHLWFHAKNMPGSHVILCTSELLDKSIEEAAEIAAFYSKGKGSPKVEVDYTYIRNLKKPASGKPGMVIYHTNWTLVTQGEKLPIMD